MPLLFSILYKATAVIDHWCVFHVVFITKSHCSKYCFVSSEVFYVPLCKDFRKKSISSEVFHLEEIFFWLFAQADINKRRWGIRDSYANPSSTNKVKGLHNLKCSTSQPFFDPQGEGGRLLHIVAYTGRLRPKGLTFCQIQASGIWEGKDFTSWSTLKRKEICHFGQ